MVTGGFLRLGGTENDGVDTMSGVIRKVGVNLTGGVEGGCGFLSDGNLHLAKAEYCHAVYCDAT